MDRALRELVRRRAGDWCEYCLLDQEFSNLPHQVEHVVAKQHGGSDDPGNLALACNRCNLHKGPNLTGIDSVSGDVVALFHPRRDRWADHFSMHGPQILGITAVGRATVRVLAMNHVRRMELRSVLPPTSH